MSESKASHVLPPPGRKPVRARLALETKLILCVMALLTFAVGLTCIVFAREAKARVSDILGEQACQLATALSRSSERAIRAGDWDELNRTGQDLIKSRNILFVGFLDSNSNPHVLASRDVDAGLKSLMVAPAALMKVTERYSSAFGNYIEVSAPILASPLPPQARIGAPESRLLGFVCVGVSKSREEALLMRVNILVTGCALLTIIAALPVAYALVHRIFLPIRQLVRATERITRGDLDTRVETDRTDTIGQLARAFDEMVGRVRAQQQQLADANRDLERKVQDRTAELAAANTLLQSEIAQKDEFVRTVSHDLNAPLRNISGLTAMLLTKHRGSFEAEVLHRLERIKANVDQESDLISELLELSRIKTRRQEMEPVDVERVVEDLRDVFAMDLRTRSIELRVESPLPVLHAEKIRVRQLFQNLIDNAIKYMGDSEKRQVLVGCELRDSEAEFHVADTGVGIEPDERERIFTVFRRGKNSLATRVAGKGVGLASVKSIIETYKGRLWVQSEPGKGSVFHFTIPRQFILEPAPPAAAPPMALKA